MPFVFSGKRFLVTGAGRDIGRALAKSIASAGGEVYALGRNREHIESLAKECENIHPIIVDLSDWEIAREEIKKLPALHGVVNNAAGPIPSRDAIDFTKEQLNSTLDITLLAPINVIQVTAKKMIEAGIHGSIVNISSMTAISASKGIMDYNVSKAGLDMVTKQFALELGKHQIRVNSVNLTGVRTPLTVEYFEKSPDLEQVFKTITPLGRLCEIPEVVGPVMYLLSEYSTMVTGTLHVVDGGLLSNIPV